MLRYLKKRRKSSKMSKNSAAKVEEKKEEDKPAPVPVKANKKSQRQETVSKKQPPSEEPVPFDLEPIEKEQTDIVLKHRKKKGKKPKFKKIQRPKPERDIGSVERVKNNFYPSDVDFRYTSCRENWVSFFGQEEDLDLGDSVRILPDVTETTAQQMI